MKSCGPLRRCQPRIETKQEILDGGKKESALLWQKIGDLETLEDRVKLKKLLLSIDMMLNNIEKKEKP